MGLGYIWFIMFGTKNLRDPITEKKIKKRAIVPYIDFFQINNLQFRLINRINFLIGH